MSTKSMSPRGAGSPTRPTESTPPQLESGAAGPRARVFHALRRIALAWTTDATPTRRIIVQASGIWLATRALLLLVTYFAVTLSSFGEARFPLGTLLARWDRFDAKWYLMVSQYGYWQPTAATFVRDGGQMPTAFFPLYPILIRLLTFILGDAHRLLAAMIISNLGTLAAFIGLALLAAAELDESAASRVVWVFAAYPVAFFLAAAYSEGIFLALAVFCLYFARREAWYRASLCAALAALTRFTGVILLLPLIWEYGSQHHVWRRSVWVSGQWKGLLGRRTIPEALAIACAVPLGIGLYMAYLAGQFGDPLSFVHAADKSWLHVGMPFWQSVPLALHGLFSTPGWTYQQALIFLDLAPVVAFSVITLVLWRRAPVTFDLYMLGLLLVILSAPVTWSPDAFASASRYLLAALPIFLVFGAWIQRRPALEPLLVGGGFLLQGMLLTLWLTTPAYIT